MKLRDFRHFALGAALACPAVCPTGCAAPSPDAEVRADLDTPGTFYAPTPIADQVQQLIDDSGAGPMFASADTEANVLTQFRSTGYQKLVILGSDVAPIAGETKVVLGSREVRLARPTSTSETTASMVAKWFGSSTGAFYARDAAPETLDVLRTALGTSAAENPDVVIITQGAGTITATRGGSAFAITAAGRCPGAATVAACLTTLAGITGWTVLQPHSGTGGVPVTGVALSHPVIEMFKASGLDARETALKSWIASNPTLVDLSLDSATYKP